MNETKALALSESEQRLLNDSFGTGHTSRRVRGIVLSGLIALSGLVVFPIFGFGFPLLATLFVLMVGVSILEKLTYTKSMSNYDSLVRKLANRIEVLEGLPMTARDGQSPLTEHGSPDQRVAW
jgi:hypothetical protein